MARNNRSVLREGIDVFKRCRDAKRLYESDSQLDTVAALFLLGAAVVSVLVAVGQASD